MFDSEYGEGLEPLEVSDSGGSYYITGVFFQYNYYRKAVGVVRIDSDGFSILVYSCPNISRDLIKAGNRGFILLLLGLTGKGANRAKSGFV